MTDSNWNIPSSKFLGDNTIPIPIASHWTTSSDTRYVDSSDLAFFEGHGSQNGLIFGDNSVASWSSPIKWGDTIGSRQLAWVAIDGCSVLQRPNTNWYQTFKGIHGIVGWQTDAYVDTNWGYYFAHRMLQGKSVWEAWKYAYDQTPVSRGSHHSQLAVLYAQSSDGSCLNDRLYGHGYWVTPGDHNTPGVYPYVSIVDAYYPP